MAWNDIPARNDKNLSFQAYYARTNVLYSLLRPTSKFVFDQIWESAERSTFKELKKTTLVGFLMADLIQGLGLREISEIEPRVGDWLIHSGVTNYCRLETGVSEARIDLPSGEVRGIVRTECNLSSTASANMVDCDDISLVVGRLISPKKFDLVAAGYREPSLTVARVRNINLSSHTLGGVADLAKLAEGAPWSSNLLNLDVQGVSSRDLLDGAVIDTLARFQCAIEEQGTWRLLHDDAGHVMHERQHQGMFRMFSRLTFGSLGIHLDANSDHGSGPTDFTLRLNSAIAIMEFKKDDKLSEIRHGISVQLPIYMRSAGADRGFYVVMCHRRDPEGVMSELANLARADSSLDGISCIVVDCRRKISASKAPTRSAVAGEETDLH
ncbi:hypothetical protein [Streptomyces sp. NPDC059863]|uniref:hypothetical protein n=1 Tax=unclassified Streptomyces TaxID=2593676 RepID=UPI0036540CDB